MAGTSYEYQYAFCIMSRSVILIMRNVSDKFYSEDQDTHFIFNKLFFLNRSI